MKMIHPKSTKRPTAEDARLALEKFEKDEENMINFEIACMQLKNIDNRKNYKSIEEALVKTEPETLKSKDYEYKGQVKDGKAHGYGVRTWKSGDIESGLFHNGLLDGFANKLFSSGGKYSGEWRESKHHGQGTYTYSNGNVYTGSWERGTKHGHGTFTWQSGSVYIGNWERDQRSGHGTYTYANGDIYEGEFLNADKHGHAYMHGHGTFTWPNGDVYIGNFKQNQRNGYGTYTFADGEYEGEWLDGVRHGQGKMTYKESGKVDEGKWKNNKFI